ncbi:MAG: hypothetical protein ACOWWM_03270 [Desulfobacterales bacterium]
MDPVYASLKRAARSIVARFPVPDFYRDHLREYQRSRRSLEIDPLMTELTGFVAGQLDNDYGHGLDHALKVARDAGAIVLVEYAVTPAENMDVLTGVRLAQAAGLLHDIRRKVSDHAAAGAAAAAPILDRFRFSPRDIDAVCHAISNHEAFRDPIASPFSEARLISDSLYDADKFRWGPDNFNDMVWEMVAFTNPPLKEFVSRYPSGMAKLRRIRSTFRSRPGRRYGPQFIDLGIAIGEELLSRILREYSHLL